MAKNAPTSSGAEGVVIGNSVFQTNDNKASGSTSVFSATKDKAKQAAKSYQLKKAYEPLILSGELGEKYGLVDFSGNPNYVKASPDARLIAARVVKERMDRVIFHINTLPPEKRNILFPGWEGKNWKLPIKSAYITQEEKAAEVLGYSRGAAGRGKVLPQGHDAAEGGGSVSVALEDRTYFPTLASQDLFIDLMTRSEAVSTEEEMSRNGSFVMLYEDV